MNAAQSLLHLLLPATCHACGSVLVGNERLLCLDCQLALAGSPMPAAGGNPTELLMYGRTGCKAAASAMRFTQQSTVQRVVHAMKFHGSAELCVAMGRDLGAPCWPADASTRWRHWCQCRCTGRAACAVATTKACCYARELRR